MKEYEIGFKIKKLRTKRNISQKALCNRLLSRAILSKMENNRMLPSIPQLESISQSLEVDISFFFQNNTLSIDNYESYRTDNLEYIDFLLRNDRFTDVIDLYNSKILKNIDKHYLNYYLGLSYFYLNLIKDCIPYLKKFVSDYFKLDDYRNILDVEKFATVMNILASIELKNKNFNKALNYLNRSKTFLKNFSKTFTRNYDKTINNLGSIYCIKENFDKCIDLLETYLVNNKFKASIDILPSIHLSLNIAYCKLGRYDTAIFHIKKSIFLFEYCNKEFNSLECYINCLRFQEKYHEAFNLLDTIHGKVIQDKKLLFVFLVPKMLLYFNVHDYENALKISSTIEVSSLRIKNKNEYYFMLGHILFEKNHFSTSYNYFKKCHNFLLSNKYFSDLALLYADLFHITKDKKYKTKSIRYSKETCYYKLSMVSKSYF